MYLSKLIKENNNFFSAQKLCKIRINAKERKTGSKSASYYYYDDRKYVRAHICAYMYTI